MLKYNNTSEVEPLESILGQERAISAMEIGLKINNPAYNIYVAGCPGTGKTTYTLKALNKYVKGKSNHKDWCYVYNFEHPREPIVIGLEKGIGKTFKKDIEKLIESLLDELKDAFESEDYELGKNQLLEDFDIEKEALLKKIKKYGEEKGFKLKNSKVGMVFIPIKEDEEEEEDENSEEEFYKVKRELENMAIQVVYKIRDLEDEAREAVLELEEEVGRFVIDPHIQALCEKYKEYDKVNDYLQKMRDDILEYIYLFYLDEEELKDKYDKEHFIKYKVNLFVDNGSEKEEAFAPVIVEMNPSPLNLFGKVEYDYYNGNLKTDFTKILPGAVHRANGGYLVLYADQLLRYPLSWDMLKRTIQSKQITVDTQTAIKPESMPIDMKVILIGSNYIYNVLYSYDNDFNKYFKVFVDFDDEMEKNNINEDGIARFIALQCNKNELKHFTYDAVNEVIKFSTRITGDKYKLSTQFNRIMEIVYEGNAYADIRESEYVEEEDVKKAIKERRKRLNKIESKMDESVENGFTLIEIEGQKIGVINGLSVLSTGEYSFGKPSRITVTTSPGNKGIVNIEREVNMSGPIHNKGVLILGGYLSENFAQEFPLSINAYICFEQNYGGVDGDSASGAELYALISSLSGIPIKQNIAVTGSINQKGEVQVVGGITEKIEGFYFTCKKKGLNKNQGVIIPKNNSRNLVLQDEVMNAIKDGEFHIYTVERVEEAVEILTDFKFEEIKKLVKEKLYKFSEIQNIVKG
ncbi:ATP-binding protein [Romboutsia maritimum]|uniref:endopeptidase La n=1 Tax=Romboutsia maritimum TaxID=2020948 RepID=A0A255HXR8_9FIRM|nr:ATP-binding protein [Romboutsia maritimum]RDY24110.1 ATP-binding protein [Romboutsia maritimum]